MTLRFVLRLAVGLCLVVGFSSLAKAARPPEPLYFSVAVEENGHTVATPKLLGFEGHRVVVERRAQLQESPLDYRLALVSEGVGQGYEVQLDLLLPSGRHVGRVGLLHAEEQRISLGGETQLTLLVMRVDSPEFRLLLERAPRAGGSI